MMKFDINNYKGKYAMHCKTREEAKDFCKHLHNIGRQWCNADSYIKDTCWVTYKDNTVYFFNEDTYDSYLSAEIEEYTILEWSDFMNKEFTKADLKTGDIIQVRNGDVGIINGELHMIISPSKWYDLDSYTDNLTSGYGFEQFDIMMVRRPKTKSDCQFCAFEYGWGTLVYERKEVEEMTLEEVCRLLGKEIKIVK